MSLLTVLAVIGSVWAIRSPRVEVVVVVMFLKRVVLIINVVIFVVVAVVHFFRFDFLRMTAVKFVFIIFVGTFALLTSLIVYVAVHTCFTAVPTVN